MLFEKKPVGLLCVGCGYMHRSVSPVTREHLPPPNPFDSITYLLAALQEPSSAQGVAAIPLAHFGSISCVRLGASEWV